MRKQLWKKKNLDWGNIGFSYVPTDMRYVADYKNGVWGEGRLTADSTVVLNECVRHFTVLQECLRIKGVYHRGRQHRYLPSGLKCRAHDGLCQTSGDACVP